MSAFDNTARLVEVPGNPVPEGAAVSLVAGRGRLPLRVAVWPATATPARGTVVLVQGRAEFIEKYFEVVGELRARGFAVVTHDLRGQGGSGRLLADPGRGHVASFHDYIADIETVVATVAKPALPKPYYALAHSTGAAAVLLGVKRLHRHFARIVGVSPLLGIRAVGAADGLVGLGLDLACLFGLGAHQVSPRRIAAAPPGVFEGNPFTSDPDRYARARAVAESHPELAIGPPTLRWVKAARDATILLRKKELIERMTTPTLLLAGGADRIVSVPAIERLGKALPAGGAVLVPGARHELMMEQDRYRAAFWAAFDAFIPGEQG